MTSSEEEEENNYFYILIKSVTSSAPRPQAFGRNAAPQADLRPRRQYDAAPPAGVQPRRPGRGPAGSSMIQARRLEYSSAGRDTDLPGGDMGLSSQEKDLPSSRAVGMRKPATIEHNTSQ